MTSRLFIGSSFHFKNTHFVYTHQSSKMIPEEGPMVAKMLEMAVTINYEIVHQEVEV